MSRIVGGVVLPLLLLGTGACTAEPSAPPREAATSSAPSADEGSGTATASSPERLVTLTVGHCWIDPVGFEGERWVAVMRDQFGWGGGDAPKAWEVRGMIMRESDSRSRYIDVGGEVLDLVPITSPEGAEVLDQACR
jgi:hypothetical protein